jgi:hypothetical protein
MNEALAEFSEILSDQSRSLLHSWIPAMSLKDTEVYRKDFMPTSALTRSREN